MEKKMTAVEWLVNHWRKLQKEGEKMSWNQIIEITELCKQMEREQIEEAIVVCLEEYGCNIPLPEDAQKEIASEYFTQKYGHGKD